VKFILEFLHHTGAIIIFIKDIILSLREIKKIGGSLVEQMYRIGIESVPIVFLTSAFVGMVTAVQVAYQIRDYAPLDFLGAGVGKMVMIELGPVLTALVIAGRVGAGIAAEVGTMRVTEQIDALECMAIDPIRFLVLPKILAGLIMIPLLTVLAEVLAIISAAFISHMVVDLAYSVFFQGMRLFFEQKELFGGLAKSLVFSFIITLMGSYFGYNSKGGAVGVGKSTTQAVVVSSILILGADYILGVLIYG